MPLKLSLIVAMNDFNRGIGIKGKLPWKISKDLKHFSRVTTFTNDPYKKNAVIMGRLTWSSIPKAFRPLPNRLNVIISSKMTNANCDCNDNASFDDILFCKTFDEAIELLNNEYSDKIESIYAIGGSQIYQSALSSKYLNSDLFYRIYLTRVFSTVECDTFMEPQNFLESFVKLTDIADKNNFNVEFNTIITEAPKNEGGDLKYCFEIYEKSNSLIN
jgi:dihydrofolate reductase